MAGQDDSLKAAPGLGKRVKLVRELGGFSQAAFGKLFGVGEGSIQAWEHSTKSTLPRKRVTEFRDRFGVDPNWLWLAEGREPRWVFRPEQWSHLDRIEARINQIADHFGLPAIPADEDELPGLDLLGADEDPDADAGADEAAA